MTSKDIVDGFRDKTLALLWEIVVHFDISLCVSTERLQFEVPGSQRLEVGKGRDRVERGREDLSLRVDRGTDWLLGQCCRPIHTTCLSIPGHQIAEVRRSWLWRHRQVSAALDQRSGNGMAVRRACGLSSLFPLPPLLVALSSLATNFSSSPLVPLPHPTLFPRFGCQVAGRSVEDYETQFQAMTEQFRTSSSGSEDSSGSRPLPPALASLRTVLHEWCQAVVGGFGVDLPDLAGALADGRALCLLIHY